LIRGVRAHLCLTPFRSRTCKDVSGDYLNKLYTEDESATVLTLCYKPYQN